MIFSGLPRKKKKAIKKIALKTNSMIIGSRGIVMMPGVATIFKQLADEGVTVTIIDIGQSYKHLALKND